MENTFLQELQANAFPALQTVMYDGWAVRFGGGFTLRVNCADQMYPGIEPIGEKLDNVEQLYKNAGLPPIIKLHDGMPNRDMVDKELERRGYALERRGNIFICDLLANPPKTDGRAVVEGVVRDEWLASFLDMNGTVDKTQRTAAFAMLKNIAMPTLAASVYEDGRMVACGLGVYERGFVGLYDIFVHKDCRRRGLGNQICQAIMLFGRDLGAENAYLQVLSDNLGARAMYTAMGFEEDYEYWFRVKRS